MTEKETRINNWEKINIADHKEYAAFYMKEFGLITNIYMSCSIVDGNGYTVSGLYANLDPSTKKTDDKQAYRYEPSLDTVFDVKLYKLKSNYSFDYPHLDRFTLNYLEPVKVKYKIKMGINYNVVIIDNGTTHERQTFTVSDKREWEEILDGITVWATKDKITKYVQPVLMDLKVGQKYLYGRKRFGEVCEVVKTYGYPDKYSKNICQIAFADGKTQDVEIGDKKFVYIPLDYKDELSQFNECLNEIILQPRLIYSGDKNLINVMWQPIEEAARYVVKLYKYEDEAFLRKVYFLKEYEVDRNECFLSVNNLIVSDASKCIVVVTAENRAGETVARSRGIGLYFNDGNGRPKWW